MLGSYITRAVLSLQMLWPPSTTRFGALSDAATTSRSIAVSFSTSRCPHFCSWRPRTPHPQAPVAAGHGVLAGDEEQRQTIIRTHLHRRISNQRSRLRTPSLLSGRSTADRRPGLPRQVSASTASWCTAPITSCRVSPSQRRSQPAVKATDVLQKSPHVFQ